MLWESGVFPVPACPHVDGDALALVEDLDASDGDPGLDLGARKAVGDRIVVSTNLDMIVDADPAYTPLTVFVGFWLC